jgi:hypothetical protein
MSDQLLPFDNNWEFAFIALLNLSALFSTIVPIMFL